MGGCTLHLGGELVLTAVGGTPDVEYCMFDPGEIELQASGPGAIREVGYRTSVGDARARLAELDLVPARAEEAAAAARPAVARAYSRGPTVRALVEHFGAPELFEGGTFEATGTSAGRYVGSWLDLGALARDLRVPGAGAVIQGLHLAAWLAERRDDDPVVLATAEITAQRRPGERTHKRVALESPTKVVHALKALRLSSGQGIGDDPPSTPGRAQASLPLAAVLERLRAGAQRGGPASERFREAEARLALRCMPTRGPLADLELWAIESVLAEGDIPRALGQLDAVERRRGRLPGTAYLRERAAFLSSSDDPRDLAERVAALSTSLPDFHELELLAAQACSAADDLRRARAFARDLAENSTAPDSLRVRAMDVLGEAGGADSRGSLPVAEVARPVEASLGRQPSVEERPAGPPQAGPVPAERSSSTTLPASPPRSPAIRPSSSSMAESHPSPPSAPAGASLPPFQTDSGDDGPPPETARSPDVERVEELTPPADTPGEPPPRPDEAPKTPAAARMAFTVLARELARDLRVQHGLELKLDLEGLERSQRYLREALADGRVRTPEERREVMRHGAFLSELLARRLGAKWVDVASPDPGRWAMLVPQASQAGGTLRIWPLGRVLRFVVMGHKERDLVSYYLELESRTR
ncbi:MAG TPA: hypothetical protein VKU41_05785 [Polyangiaceae bacterium]|nr:hypothetical protein [Polyangiaceae bacterium]